MREPVLEPGPGPVSVRFVVEVAESSIILAAAGGTDTACTADHEADLWMGLQLLQNSPVHSS